MKIWWAEISTPLGKTYVASSLMGAVRVSIPVTSKEAFISSLEEIPGARLEEGLSENAQVITQLEEYWSGSRTSFTVPIDLIGSAFEKSVWNSLKEVRYGETTTYGAIAKRIGQPSGAQAVGVALGRNPVAIILPCHRVMGKKGDLTGFAAGPETKAELLKFEGSLLL